MGKKRKNLPEDKGIDLTEKFDSVIENIQKEIRTMNKSNDLIIGTNAVLRGLERNYLCIVMLNTDKASSAIYHALKLWCKKTDVLFISLKKDSKLLQDKKLFSSTTFGVKKPVLCVHQNLSDLLTKINFRQKRLKQSEQHETCSKIDGKLSVKNEAHVEMKTFENESNTAEEILEADYYHSSCRVSRTELENENFLSLETNLEPNVEFMNYGKQCTSNFCVHVK